MEKEKQNVEDALNNMINYHLDEARKYQAMIGMLNKEANFKITVNEEKQCTPKRNANFGTKRGPYKKNKKVKKSGMKIPIVNWAEVFPRVLRETGKAMTAGEIVNHEFSSKHKNTRRVLKSRASAMSSFHVTAGTLIRHKSPTGGVKLSLANA